MANLTDNEFVRHIPCDQCGSSDANSLYSDGHTYCYVCHHRTAGDNEILTTSMTQNVTLKGEAQRLNKRNISEKTCQFFRIFRDGDTLRFPYFTGDGVLKGCKVKNKQKIFTYEGVSTDTLFGQHLFPSTGKRIVITEGELDAASAYEALPGWAVVSLPHGAASAKKDLQKQIPLLQGYEEIILFFDRDDPGREATEAAASILPPGKVKIARLDEVDEHTKNGQVFHHRAYKDASEALQDDDPQAIRMAIWNAEPYRPDGIVDGNKLYEIVQHHKNLMTTNTHSKDLMRSYTGSGMANLQHLLLALVQEKPQSCVNLQLTSSMKGSQLGCWNLKQTIGEQHLD